MTFAGSIRWGCLFQGFRSEAIQPTVPPFFNRRQVDLCEKRACSAAVDGFIAAGVNHQNLLELFTRLRAPFSVFGDTVQGPWNPKAYDVVCIDDIQGAYDVTRHLLGLGHRAIWYVANSRFAWFARRCEGYTRAMEEAGLQPLVASIDSDLEHEVGFLSVRQMLSKGDQPDAIFAGSDATAHGVYDALREAGIRIPRDISVAGFNDTPEAIMLYPPLTSVRVFPDHVGRSLAELRRIEDPVCRRKSTRLLRR